MLMMVLMSAFVVFQRARATSDICAVNSFDSTSTDWITHGASPYLSVKDYSTNYIYADDENMYEGWFGFANTTASSGTVTATLKINAWGNYNAYDYVVHVDYSGGAGTEYALTSGNNNPNAYQTVNLGSLTVAQANALRLQILNSQTDGTLFIDYSFAYFNYTATPPSYHPPVIGTPSPVNGTTGQPISFSWSVPITDAGGTFDWTIQCNNTQSSSANGASNGTKSLSLTGLSYNHPYKVWVNATDGVNTTRKWYTFTTRTEYIPSPPSSFTATAITRFRIDLSWSKGSMADKTYVEAKVNSYPSSRTDGTNIYNNTGTSYSHTGLSPNQHWYYRAWSWNTTDKAWSSTYESANAITLSNTAPNFGTPSPVNGSTGQPVAFSWSIPINDVNGDTFNWTLQCNNTQSSSANGASNGTKSLSLTGLSYNHLYKVWVNATDGYNITRAWYRFTTAGYPTITISHPFPTGIVTGTSTAINGRMNSSAGRRMNVSLWSNITTGVWHKMGYYPSITYLCDFNHDGAWSSSDVSDWVTYHGFQNNGTWAYYLNASSFGTLASDSTYWFSFNVTDGVTWKNQTYSFITSDFAPPSSSANPITPYWNRVATTITATASDTGSGVKNVTLYYRFAPANSTWGAWTLFSTDVSAPWSWSFTFPDDYGHYQFYTRAYDNAGNHESAPGGADAIAGYDTVAPLSSVNPITPYIHPPVPFNLTVTYHDYAPGGTTGASGVYSYQIYYRYSTNNITWGSWTPEYLYLATGTPQTQLFGTTFSPFSIGYYQVYSRAEDAVRNMESAPGSADTIFRVIPASPPHITGHYPYNGSYLTMSGATLQVWGDNAAPGINVSIAYYQYMTWPSVEWLLVGWANTTASGAGLWGSGVGMVPCIGSTIVWRANVTDGFSNITSPSYLFYSMNNSQPTVIFNHPMNHTGYTNDSWYLNHMLNITVIDPEYDLIDLHIMLYRGNINLGTLPLESDLSGYGDPALRFYGITTNTTLLIDLEPYIPFDNMNYTVVVFTSDNAARCSGGGIIAENISFCQFHIGTPPGASYHFAIKDFIPKDGDMNSFQYLNHGVTFSIATTDASNTTKASNSNVYCWIQEKGGTITATTSLKILAPNIFFTPEYFWHDERFGTQGMSPRKEYRVYVGIQKHTDALNNMGWKSTLYTSSTEWDTLYDRNMTVLPVFTKHHEPYVGTYYDWMTEDSNGSLRFQGVRIEFGMYPNGTSPTSAEDSSTGWMNHNWAQGDRGVYAKQPSIDSLGIPGLGIIIGFVVVVLFSLAPYMIVKRRGIKNVPQPVFYSFALFGFFMAFAMGLFPLWIFIPPSILLILFLFYKVWGWARSGKKEVMKEVMSPDAKGEE